MAGVEAGMMIKTRALRQEVSHVPAPPGFDYERDGFVTSDGDIGCYARPEIGKLSALLSLFAEVHRRPRSVPAS